MGGPVLGGGAIVVVAVVLWLAYFVPSWQMRARYNAAERNAARLNQALRVLAETSERPEEVRVELSRREAARQHRLVKRLQAEDDKLRAESDKLEVERKKHEVEARRLEKVAAVEEERQRLAAVRADPRIAQARVRRRVRLVATTIVLLGLAGTGLGAWQFLAAGVWGWVAVGAGAVVLGGGVLVRMAVVASRARSQGVAPVSVVPPTRRAEPQLLNPEDRGWTPRPLPAPLTATAGSRASGEVRAARAQEAARRAQREEVARTRLAAEQQPVAIGQRSRASAPDDAAIEAHVRDLLARRAAS